jgi:hypothetical protein
MLIRSSMAAGSNAQAPNHIQQALLRAGLSVETLRALSPLSQDAQRVIDTAVTRVGLDRLVIASDLMSAGLTYDLPNAMSVTELQWDNIPETGGAQRTMHPSARGEFQLPDRASARIPIYLTTDDFSMGIRTLLMSQRIGAPLDTTLAESATRRVNEAIEDSVINGATTTGGAPLQVNGGLVPGIINAPGITKTGFAGGEPWNVAGHTGDEVLADVLAMVAAQQANRFWGPYNLYIPTTYGLKLAEDFKTNVSGSIFARLQEPEMQFGGRPIAIRIADMMPTDKIAMVQMTSDVLDLVIGQEPTVVPWTSLDGFTLFWMVLAIVVPRIKVNSNGKTGIVVGSPSGTLLREGEEDGSKKTPREPGGTIAPGPGLKGPELSPEEREAAEKRHADAEKAAREKAEREKK